VDLARRVDILEGALDTLSGLEATAIDTIPV
jgi:hypothetical protein